MSQDGGKKKSMMGGLGWCPPVLASPCFVRSPPDHTGCPAGAALPFLSFATLEALESDVFRPPLIRAARHEEPRRGTATGPLPAARYGAGPVSRPKVGRVGTVVSLGCERTQAEWAEGPKGRRSGTDTVRCGAASIVNLG